MEKLKSVAVRWMLAALLICAAIVAFGIFGCHHSFGAQSPRGAQTFPKLGTKKTTAPALPPLPPGYQAVADTNLYMLGIKRTNANNLYLTWTGPAGTVFQLTSKTNINGAWSNIGAETTNRSTVIPAPSRFTIYKVRSATSPVVPGQLQWLSAQGTSVGLANGVTVDHAGNSIVVGQFQGTANFGGGPVTSAGAADIFIAKYSPQGSLVWAKVIGGLQDDGGNSVAIDSANNIIVTGYFSATVNFGGTSLTASNGNDIFAAKYSSAGALIWAKGWGAQANDWGRAIAVDSGNNVLMAGYFSFSVNFGGTVLSCPHGTEMVLMKLSPAGVISWVKGYGDPGTGQCETFPRNLAVDANGDLFVIGDYSLPANLGGGMLPFFGYNFFVGKYAGADGTYRWAKGIGSDDKNQGRGIAITPAGNVITTGTIQGTVNLGCGNVTSAYPTLFLAAYNSGGTCLWVTPYQTLDSFSSGWGGAVTVDVDGTIGLTGQIKGGVLMAPNQPLSGGGDVNLMIATFSTSGNNPPVYRWGRAFPGGQSGGNAVAFDSLGHVLTAGYFKLTKDFGGITATGQALGSSFTSQYNK